MVLRGRPKLTRFSTTVLSSSVDKTPFYSISSHLCARLGTSKCAPAPRPCESASRLGNIFGIPIFNMRFPGISLAAYSQQRPLPRLCVAA